MYLLIGMFACARNAAFAHLAPELPGSLPHPLSHQQQRCAAPRVKGYVSIISDVVSVAQSKTPDIYDFWS